jgi:hypothetical protein
MKEVPFYNQGKEKKFLSPAEAIRERRSRLPHETISVVFEPKGSAIANAEVSNFNWADSLVVYYDKSSINVDSIGRTLDVLRKAQIPISFHLSINKFSEPELIKFGLHLAENHELLNGIPPLLLIDGRPPKRFVKAIQKTVNLGKADAIFCQKV